MSSLLYASGAALSGAMLTYYAPKSEEIGPYSLFVEVTHGLSVYATVASVAALAINVFAGLTPKMSLLIALGVMNLPVVTAVALPAVALAVAAKCSYSVFNFFFSGGTAVKSIPTITIGPNNAIPPYALGPHQAYWIKANAGVCS